MAYKRYYVSLSKLAVFLDNLKKTFANITHTHTKSEIVDMPVNISEFNNDAKYLTASNIPTVLNVEEWQFTYNDNSVTTKSVATITSIANEELVFELENGSTVVKKVVIE